MTFFHAPTLSSLAIGLTLTFLDLYIAQHFASAHMLNDLNDGELRVTHVVGVTTIFHQAVELIQQDLRERAVQPLSNMRLKLAAPATYGSLPFVQSRN